MSTARPSPPSPTPSLEQMLCFAVYSAGLSFNRLYKPHLDRLGLTYPQYLVLILLRDNAPMSLRGLGERLFLESNTLTPLIKRMEAGGIVSRRRDAEDERVVRVSLTEAGRALAREAECIPGQILAATGRDAASLEGLRKALVDLRDAIREVPDEA